jgi:glycerophosphoryl diester phosphodiesterase
MRAFFFLPAIAHHARHVFQPNEKNVTRGQWEPKRVDIIGHRGSPYTALENTARSFIHAARAGADGVELDVFLLKCGTLVVFHGSGGDENPGLLKSYCGVPGSM